MESSDSSMSSDWDVINHKDLPEDILEESSFEINVDTGLDDAKECSPVGSSVHVLTEEEMNEPKDILNETNIDHHNEIFIEKVIGHHSDSNSSSDIDVIEEGEEEMRRSGMLLPTINFLSPDLEESGPLVPAIAPAPAPNAEGGWNYFFLAQRFLRHTQFKEYFVIIVIAAAVAASIHLNAGISANKMKQMKDEVDELKKENTDLKDRVISKIGDDKLFQTLEEQINTLKIENLKLSGSLESLILHLQIQEESENLKKDHKMRANDLYKIEIDRLKEQVNLLKIDNDDLQQQLVRIRYGGFSHSLDEGKVDFDKREVKPDEKNDSHENSSEFLSEEIEKLKQKLNSEVNDLKDWKKSIDNLIKQFNENENKGHENDFDTKNMDGGKFRKHTKDETHEKKKKEKFYDWSWKDFKKNFDNIPDMLSKYINVDEKKVKEAFESMNNYFKKAQEKTKNMFKHYNEKGKKEAWDILSTLQSKWDTMRREFFDNHNKKYPQPPKYEGGSSKPDPSEKPNKKDKKEKLKFEEVYLGLYNYITKHQKDINPDQEIKVPNVVQQRVVLELMKKDPETKHFFEDDTWREHFSGVLKKHFKSEDHEKNPEDSWLFNRAATRSVLREMGKEEDATNWFLRRKKMLEEGTG